MMEKAREHQRNLYMCFIDYKKAFDCVDHERLSVVLSDMGVPVSIIENIKPEWTLESRVAKAALSYFGHLVRAGGMEDDVMLGRMNGARKGGRPMQRWVDTLKGYASGATISDIRRDARERAGWRGATTAVARGRMRLDGTR